MARTRITRRDALLGGIAATVAVSTAAHATPVPDDEIIRVAPDHWSFETARTHRRVVPFGSNLVLSSKDDLNLFGPRYTHDRYEAILAACEGVGINILKVFLPIYVLLPDPQVAGEAHVAPGYLENLDDFLALCTKHHIRAVVTLAEWGGHTLAWWKDGGQYFGRNPWKTDPGIDSLDILCHFWRQLGRRLRGNPAVFAYSPTVEWSIPAGNLTPPWAPTEDKAGLVPGDIALWYWRAWLEAKYRTVDALNRAHGATYASFGDVPPAQYAYDFAAHKYVAGDRAVLDYSNFREWTTLRYFRPQIAAVRKVDPTHMVTISNHERCWNLWEGAARHFLGYTPFEEKVLVDYVTHHDNRDEAEIGKSRTMETVVRELKVMGRFAYAGRPMPVIAEEFTFASVDPKRSAEGQAAMVRGTVGSLSGWMTWYLQYPNGANEADAIHQSAWFDANLKPTPWGETARSLHAEIERGSPRRKPAARTIKLERSVELGPKTLSTLIRETQRPASEGPSDYTVAHERDLDIRLAGDAVPHAAKYRCAPVIAGNLCPF
jgi:hypothetical protein